MSSLTSQPTSFITSIVRHAIPTATSTSTTTPPPSTPYPISTSVPEAPPAVGTWGASRNDGWSPTAIIGIVTAIVLLLLSVPLIAILLRRYERKRLRETVKGSGSRGSSSSSSKASLTSTTREDQSLRNILVTRELQRTSAKLVDGVVGKPERAHGHERAWSRTEVRGGEWKCERLSPV